MSSEPRCPKCNATGAALYFTNCRPIETDVNKSLPILREEIEDYLVKTRWENYLKMWKQDVVAGEAKIRARLDEMMTN